MLHPTYPIVTPRLLLRPFTFDDLDALYDLNAREEVVRYLYWGARTRAEARAMIEVRRSRVALDAEGDAIVAAIERRDSGAMIGDVNLRWLSAVHQQGEVGWVIHPDHQRNGYAREATLELLRLGFEGLGLRRIVARCDARNAASTGLMERLGMRREAHLHQNEFVKGEWTDEYIYAMLADEWAVRAGRDAGHAT